MLIKNRNHIIPRINSFSASSAMRMSVRDFFVSPPNYFLLPLQVPRLYPRQAVPWSIA